MAEINFLMGLLYGHSDPLEGLHEGEQVEMAKALPFDTGNAELPNPVARFFEKAERNLLLKSAGLADSSWDAELTKATVETDPAALPARSLARLEKVNATINRIFNGHEVEAAEARKIAKRLLIETRAEVAAAITAMA
jgi:hypothetical protein